MANNRKLIVVSNRLPIRKAKTGFTESDGGLVSALRTYFEREAGSDEFAEKIWIGAADFPESHWVRYAKKDPAIGAFRIEPVFIEDRLFAKYYDGFCNSTIWPLFHYFPSFAEFDSRTFHPYEEVNRIFAEKVLLIAGEGDVIWIHDYHFLLLPEMIRERMLSASIAFFLHIPFPSFDVFRLLHTDWKRKIMNGLLGSDLIGFHTHEYVQHFLKTMRMISGYDHTYREIYTASRVIRADVFPLGIDFEKFNRSGGDPAVIAHCNAIAKRFGDLKLLFSVDRLDYTKGVTHRLSGFEKFLEIHPEWRGRVVFIMVVVPSRQVVSKYNERRKLIEEQVGSINGKYSTLDWQPLIYRYSQVSFEELCALYQSSHVALITPLRDGMNLVAKEYVASRQAPDGVLILSELAGAANELGEAMLVNPTDKLEVAKTIYAALQYPESEQRLTMRIMQSRLQAANVVRWGHEFLTSLYDVKRRQFHTGATGMDAATTQTLCTTFSNATRRLLFLDYDGTLTPFSQKPAQSYPSDALLSTLACLTNRPATEVIIISGRGFEVLEQWLGKMHVHLVAEHGASVKLRGEHWEHFTDHDNSWKAVIRATFELYSDRSPGSFIEEKTYTMAWHYREVASSLGFTRSRELLDNLYHLIRNTHLNVLDGNKVVEVRAAGIDKGIAARKILERYPSDFVFAIGDDRTDEDVFRVLNGNSVTVKIGTGMTAAKYRIETQSKAFDFLDTLASVK